MPSEMIDSSAAITEQAVWTRRHDGPAGPILNAIHFRSACRDARLAALNANLLSFKGASMYRFLFVLAAMATGFVQAEWTHRYPPVETFNHHVYLEGFELPILNAGPMDPALSPDGQNVAFSARGWIWVMNLDSRV